jgi:hypothetical protein
MTTFGPAVGSAIAALVEGAAPALIEVLRDATGAGEDFDLAKLMSRPSAIERLRQHWLDALDMLRKGQRSTGEPVSELLRLPAAVVGPTAERWALVVTELDRLAADVDGDPAEIDYADPQLQTAWGELLGSLVVDLHTAVGRGQAFDLVQVLPLPVVVGHSWLALIGASLAEVIRETGGRGSFDLAGLMSMDTTDPRLRDVWEKLLTSLAGTIGDLVRGAIYALAGRLNVTDVKRLFELAVLSQKLMMPGAHNGYVTTYKDLNAALRRDPRAKWDLLVRCLLVTYSRQTSAGVVDA